MKTLITGADGVLGSNLVRELLNRNYKVTVFLEKGKESPTLNDLPIVKHHGDILIAEDLNQAMAGMDIVIHCAACTAVWPSRAEFIRDVNIRGTRNVIDACIENDIQRLIYVGTANSFGFGTLTDPGNEFQPYRSEQYGLDYMDSKFMAQQVVLAAVEERGLPAVVVNPTFMLGAYDSTPSSGAMIKAVAEGKVPGYTSGGKNFVYVGDVAIGIANAIEHGKIGECYILGNENLSYKDAFKKIAQVVRAKIPRKRVPALAVKFYGLGSSIFAKIFRYKPTCSFRMAKVSCDEHYYSSKKAISDLHLPQTPIEQGIKECFEWLAINGHIKTVK